MKVFQVRENKPQQTLVFSMIAVKGLQKNGTIWAIEHAFVWCIVYEQRVANLSTRIVEKKSSRFLWKIGLLGLSSRKCEFCMQNFWLNTLEACIKIYVLCLM
jgi:hypothetical protein